MRMFKGIAALLSGLMLVACGGGGGNAGTSPFVQTPTTTGPSPSVVEVLASSNSVGTAGEEVTISAIVKGTGNVSMPATAVTFSTDTGTLSSATPTTDPAGVATAKLSAGADKSNRPATVTVTAGGVSGKVTVAIEGTKFLYSGPTTLTLGGSAPLSLKATDSRGNPVADVAITVSSSLSNGLSATSLTTNALGEASLTYTATNSGTDTVQFSGAGASTGASISISGEDFSFISPAPGTRIAVGQSQTLQVRYRQGGVPQVNRTINFAATSGTLLATSATTDGSGIASVAISSTSASPSTVQATLVGATAQATLPLFFVATVPTKLVLQVTPAAIGPNAAGSTNSQAQVVAKVTDANANPVPGVTVNFSRDADPSGGNLQQPSAVTDINGQASVQYIAGAQSTASTGVVLRGTVASNSAVTGTTSLTVSQSALFIALGTGNVIENLDPQTYKKNWVAYVTDANGVAVSGVTLTIKALPTHYLKGALAFNGVAWVYNAVSPLVCDSEDANLNGTLDPGEDLNGDSVLWPGNVISVTPGTVQTDSGGRATLSLIYAESYAPWVRLKLTVTAVVAGTESKGEAVFIVDGAADDFTNEKIPPAGVFSPFGTTTTTCANPN